MTRNKLIRLALATTAMALGMSPAFAQSNFGGPIESKQIGEGVYLLSAGSNAVLVVGKKEAILVDALVAAQAEPLVKKVAELTNLPVKYVVNTHYHGDHTGANAAFRKLGAEVISTEEAAKTMAREVPNARGTMNPPLAVEGRPTQTYKGSKTIKIDGKTVKMTQMPVSHTDGDAVVYIPQANVLIMGDLHHSNEYPVYDTVAGCQCGSYDGNIKADKKVLKMANDKTVIVPGHGEVTNKAELKAYIEMLEKVRDQVNAMIKEGKSADEVVAAKLLAANPAVHAGGPDNRDSFIRVLYEALKTGRGK
ncbi:MAG: MBL fold metallo-hydrolase [Steroidobacteraceae bacterium]